MKIKIKPKKPRFKIHIGVERWKYNMRIDAYISNFGNVRDRDGEPQRVCASNNYLYYRGVSLHRLVMETWNPVPNWQNLTVDHKNHNTRDNRVSNLEWVTKQDNEDRAKQDTIEHQPRQLIKQEAGGSADVSVVLNGIKLPYSDALNIMISNKSMKMCKANVEKAFKSVLNSDKPVEYGGNVIQRAK